MSPQKTILVGIDFSSHSTCALRRASRIANAENLALICYHVLDQEVLQQFITQENLQSAEVLKSAHEKLNAFIRETIGTAHDIEAIVEIGNSFEHTLKLIEKHKVKTLVLGSRGESSYERLQIGALAARCVRKAPVEVLLVRGSQGEPFMSIGVCLDFSETSIRAAHRAAEIARQDGAALKLIQAYRSPIRFEKDFGWLGLIIPMKNQRDIREDLEKELRKLGETLSETYQLEITTEVKCCQNISEGLYEVLKEMDAELLVLGTLGLTGIKNLLIGSTAENLIQIVPCSILTVKPKSSSSSRK